MSCFPSSVLIVTIQFVLCFLVIGLTFFVALFLSMIRRKVCIQVYTDTHEYLYENIPYARKFPISPETSCTSDLLSYIYILLPIYIGCSLWIISFISAFGQMILHGVFTNWHRTSDKSSLSVTLTAGQIATIFR